MIFYVLIILFRGINEGFRDGIIAGRIEGLKEGFREGFKSGKEFGTRLGNLLIPLIKILQSGECENSSLSSPSSNYLIESARKLIKEIGTISLKNEEDMEKELRISQIEAKIKALTVNFSKRYKDSSIQIFKINKSSSTKDELSF